MKTIRRCSAFIFLMAAPFFFCSCLIPIYSQKDLGARIDPSSVRPALSTKVDVFLRFGSTFQEVSDSEKLVIATFAESDVFQVVLLVGIGYTGMAAFPVYRKNFDGAYEIEIEFDDNDVVKRCETFNLPRKQSSYQK
jgi:hypothetical protein